jgi:diguanylate cyclase (GGDEF)-like protein
VVQERVQRAIEHARRHPGYGFAVLFMDFDRFKQVNDTLGHGVGDELLRQIAQRLTDTLRPGDTVGRVDSQRQTAARIGGDEFVVVLEGIRTGADVHVVAQRLLEVLTQPYAIGPHHVQSSVSIGVVLSAQAGDSADAVLRDADTAMYEAKRAGRGRYVMFDPAMHERVVRALKLENDLRRALRERELFVVYQPVVDLRSGAVCGVEALVRWQHPQRGVVPPVEFIPVAEEAGLIAALGDFVLDAACRQYAGWRAALGDATPGLLAVNLSRAQLMTPGLVQSVRTVLQQTGLRPSQLQLEVTESLAAQDEVVQNTLLELKALGVRLALDDFGTGYSSLACLHQMPVDTVKIDRSFLHQVEDSGYHRVVIEATIRVAQTLGMICVAEGVETEAQASLMRSLHCDRGQGFLYSRPMEAAELAQWLGHRGVGPDALPRAA